MSDPTVSEILSKAIDSMSCVMGNIQTMRKSFAAYLDNNVSSEAITPKSPYSQVSSPTTASENDAVALIHCHGLQSAIMQFRAERIESSRIFVVRKVHGLVTDAAEILTSYFSRFGRVTHVELLPSRRRCGRLRPSTTGFVILENSKAVSRVLEEAMVHEVTAEHSVEVTPFSYPSDVSTANA